MPRLLKDLKITDVSSVDRGAGRHVRVLLTKRDADHSGVAKVWASNADLPDGVKSSLPTEAQTVFRRVANDRMKAGADDKSAIKQAWSAVKNGWKKQGDEWVRKDWDEMLDALTKREFSAQERQDAAESGAAMPGGGYPIKTKQDLKNAIQAIGRAKDRAATIRHIKARARALGASDMIPENWGKRDTTVGDLVEWLKSASDKAGGWDYSAAAKALDFDTAADNIEVSEEVWALMGELREALCALDCSISSILCDDEVEDKRAAVNESVEQFKSHISEFDFAGMEHPDVELDKLMAQWAEDQETLVEKADMAVQLPEKLQAVVDKMVAEAVAKAEAEKAVALKSLQDQIAKKDDEIVKLGMSAKHKAFYDGLKDEDEKKRFHGMSPEERDDHMDKTKKRYAEDPIYKQMREENEMLRKRIEKIEDERGLELAKIEAKEMGLRQANAGEIVLKMKRSCDDATYAAWKEHNLSMLRSNEALRKQSHAFEELGTSLGAAGSGSALEELNAKVAELRKSKPELTEAQAFDKVYNDPANREVMMREKQERMQKIGRAVA